MHSSSDINGFSQQPIQRHKVPFCIKSLMCLQCKALLVSHALNRSFQSEKVSKGVELKVDWRVTHITFTLETRVCFFFFFEPHRGCVPCRQIQWISGQKNLMVTFISHIDLHTNWGVDHQISWSKSG